MFKRAKVQKMLEYCLLNVTLITTLGHYKTDASYHRDRLNSSVKSFQKS